MRSKLDNLFDELENIGRVKKENREKSGWKTIVNDTFAVAQHDEILVPAGHRPARRTQGIRAGHRVTVSFKKAST